jgi:probable addiction module antidote protein
VYQNHFACWWNKRSQSKDIRLALSLAKGFKRNIWQKPRHVPMAPVLISRARGMMQLASETGITREGLYTALLATGNPSFVTIMKVCKAMGLRLRAEAVW